MAEAQYETRTETVEKTVVVLTLTEEEADLLRIVASEDPSSVMTRIGRALEKPAAPETSADTFEYGGVTYEYGTLYRDVEDDYFEIARELDADGTPVGRYRYRRPTAEPGDWGWTLGEVVATHGPLTKVTS